MDLGGLDECPTPECTMPSAPSGQQRCCVMLMQHQVINDTHTLPGRCGLACCLCLEAYGKELLTFPR